MAGIATLALLSRASADDEILAKTYPRGAAKALIVETDGDASVTRKP